MTINPIRTDDDLRAALERLEAIYQAERETPEAIEMEALVAAISVYESEHYLLADRRIT
ncbi:hypothetical protein CSV86_019650 [Pseudomonas putida CSV86]|uniref:Uncharacterized protein n=1 Tax=Pseudomonas bharatica CSV86 TaxID=1005395 RepID=L1LVX4_9PSED|nr:hypothetical protein [Pseudomonas bharatica]NNJ17234.1 hypothetical protein [Pseudomonas bharatica CSV86]